MITGVRRGLEKVSSEVPLGSEIPDAAMEKFNQYLLSSRPIKLKVSYRTSAYFHAAVPRAGGAFYESLVAIYRRECSPRYP